MNDLLFYIIMIYYLFNDLFNLKRQHSQVQNDRQGMGPINTETITNKRRATEQDS